MQEIVIDPGVMSPEETRALKQVAEAISIGDGSVRPTISLTLNVNGVNTTLPSSVAEMLMVTLDEMAEGRAVQVSTLPDELTTSQAADLLNVSRPYLIRLLDAGKLPYRLVGTHRRLLRRDVVVYRATMYHNSLEALNELTKQAKDLGLY